MSKYAGLTNEEIIMAHCLLKNKLKDLHKAIDDKLLIRVNEKNVMQKELSNDDIKQLQQSDWFLLLTSIVEKTTAVVDLLKDMPEYEQLYTKLK
jgi:hypothetical protein